VELSIVIIHNKIWSMLQQEKINYLRDEKILAATGY